jgi:rhomboid protease GluP
MCPSCRALVPKGAGRCPECGTGLSGVRGPGIGRTLTNLFPGATRATSLVVLVNCLWFILMALALYRQDGQTGLVAAILPPGGDDPYLPVYNRMILRFGALFSPYIAGPVDLWRLVPPIFVHGGILHIIFNTYVFLRVAPLVEEEYDTARLWVAYLSSGILGFVFSLGWGWLTGAPRFAVGASGAVLGLMGLLIAYGMRRGGPFGEQIKGRILEWVIFIFLISFLVGRIDHLAHAGGLAGGFLIGFVMPYGQYRKPGDARLWKGLALAGILIVVFSFFRLAMSLQAPV